MKVNKHESFIVLEDEYNDVSQFASYLTKKIPQKFNKQNVVINLLKYNTISQDELLLFLNLSNAHRSQKKSLVIVNDAIAIDDIPDEIIVVPTLLEAGDIIEMEEIERELGF